MPTHQPAFIDRHPFTRRPSVHPAQVRCKGCARVNDVSLAAPSKSAAAAGAAGEYVADGGEWQPVASFECRGVEPVRCGGGAQAGAANARAARRRPYVCA